VGWLIRISRAIDAFNLWIGKTASWLVVVAVMVSAVNATVRKLLDTSSNAWLELQWGLFSAVFLLCASWTLRVNEHVRIDIVNSLFPKRVRHTVDLVGHALFLLPLTVIMLVTGLPFFLASYRINEQSGNAGGLPQWPAKGLLLVGFAFLFAQGLSELIKRFATIRGHLPDPDVKGTELHSSAAAEAASLAKTTDEYQTR